MCENLRETLLWEASPAGGVPVGTGVRGFDRLVNGGLPTGRLYVLSGPPGGGKTTFTGQFLTRGLRDGERCLYVTIHESRADLFETLGSYTFGFERAARENDFEFLNVASDAGRRVLDEATTASEVARKVTAYADRSGVDRLVFDSVMVCQLVDDEPEPVSFVTALRRCGATTLLISETTEPSEEAPEWFLAHGVIVFHHYLTANGMERAVEIRKCRGTDVREGTHPLRFTDEGLVVGRAVPNG